MRPTSSHESQKKKRKEKISKMMRTIWNLFSLWKKAYRNCSILKLQRVITGMFHIKKTPT